MKLEDFIKANFNEHDYKNAVNFIELHNEECFSKHHDITGALLSYEFIPTGIGCFLTIKCPCGCELTIDDSFDAKEE